MARAGEVIEDMQAKGELATNRDGRPRCNKLLHLDELLGVCALDLMARAGEVIEDMQAKGELATQGRPNKCDKLSHLSDVLSCSDENARQKASRYKTANKASRDDYYDSLDREMEKPRAGKMLP